MTRKRYTPEQIIRKQHPLPLFILVQTDALGITAGHQRRTRRRADAARHIKAGELAPLRRHAVEVGRAMFLRAKRPDVRIAQVVAENNDEVGPILLRRPCQGQSQTKQPACSPQAEQSRKRLHELPKRSTLKPPGQSQPNKDILKRTHKIIILAAQ